MNPGCFAFQGLLPFPGRGQGLLCLDACCFKQELLRRPTDFQPGRLVGLLRLRRLGEVARLGHHAKSNCELRACCCLHLWRCLERVPGIERLSTARRNNVCSRCRCLAFLTCVTFGFKLCPSSSWHRAGSPIVPVPTASPSHLRDSNSECLVFDGNW